MPRYDMVYVVTSLKIASVEAKSYQEAEAEVKTYHAQNDSELVKETVIIVDTVED